jgi:hypothetical protein
MTKNLVRTTVHHLLPMLVDTKRRESESEDVTTVLTSTNLFRLARDMIEDRLFSNVGLLYN